MAQSWLKRNPVATRFSADWGESLLMYGLFAAARVLRDESTAAYVDQWLAFHLNQGVSPTYYCGSWGPGLLFPEIAESVKRPAVDLYAARLFAHIRAKALRNGQGVILHNLDQPDIFADTVYFTAVVLAKLGAYLGREWINDALLQLYGHAAVLQDPKSFLFIHAEENLSGIRSQGYWARGNGWIAMTCAELLRFLPRDHEYFKKFASFYRQLAVAVVQKQSRSGMWRTIMEDAAAYEETSATAMFLFALKRGRARGLLMDIVDEPIHKASQALVARIDGEGRVTGVSGGTLPGKPDDYKSLPTGEYPWGTGAWLLAACEMAQ